MKFDYIAIEDLSYEYDSPEPTIVGPSIEAIKEYFEKEAKEFEELNKQDLVVQHVEFECTVTEKSETSGEVLWKWVEVYPDKRRYKKKTKYYYEFRKFANHD